MNNDLIQIYNELCNINVRGEDSIAMARVLLTLREIISKGEEENGNQ